MSLIACGLALALALDEKPDASTLVEQAAASYRAGKFSEAHTIYKKIFAETPSPGANVLAALGRLSLYGNRLDEAERQLRRALDIEPDLAKAKSLLAEAYVRQDRYAEAAGLLRASGQESHATQLESLGEHPYRIDGTGQRTSLKFVMTDPLPVVRVAVNGGKPVNFLIDTGAADVFIDPEFAKEARVESIGSTTGTFAGGKKAGVALGRLDSLAVGEFTIRDLPVSILNTRQLSQPMFGGKRIDGIIGTVLFYHFFATLDYPAGKLELARKSPETLKEMNARAKSAIVVPFWMAGDHYMVAWGKVDKLPVLLFVDTGLAGGGVTLAKSVIEEAGIKLHEDQAGEGLGGGGKVKIVPFDVASLSLGSAKATNVHGLFTGAFPLQYALGFRLDGIISHGFFRRYALTFDFVNMRLLLQTR